MNTLPEWGPSNVTLLGGTIHNMTPMAGIGANTALRDTGLLRRQLVTALSAEGDLVQAVGEYEAGMRIYANQGGSSSPPAMPRTAPREPDCRVSASVPR